MTLISEVAEEPSSMAGCPETTWDEAERLAALDRYAVLDTGREAAFDDVAELAADILDAPIAVVNFIAADRQWFKAERGIGTDSLPLDVSICRHAILQPGVFVVPDLTKDPRFKNNPLVDAADGLRFYAGALLETPDGLPLGTVCVLDTKPRPEGVSPRQERALRTLAAQTMAQLELRRSHALARQESNRLAAMFAQATVGVSELGLDGRFLAVNDRLCEMMGRTREELLTLSMADVTHPDDLAENLPLFDRVAVSGGSFSLDKRYVRPDGGIVWANSAVTRLLDERGSPRAALAVTTDITARKAEERHRAFLLELGDRTRDLADPEAVVAATTRLLGERLGASRVLYADVHEADGRATVRPDWTAPGVDPLPPSVSLADVGTPIVDHLRQGRVLVVDDVRVNSVTRESVGFLDAIGVGALISVPLLKDGVLVANLNVHKAEPYAWTPAESALVEAVAERTWDAMQRAMTQAALSESETRYRQIVQGAEDFAIATVDGHGVVTSWNTGAARITGFSEEDIVGRSGEIIFTPEDRAAGAPDHELNRAHSDGRSLNERWHVRKDGSRFWGSGLTMRLDRPGGGYLKIFRDRTAEHQAEAQFRRRSEQLQGLAETASAVTRAPTLEATLQEITRAARRLVGAHQAVVSLTQGEDWAQVIPYLELSEKYSAWRDYAVPADGSGIYALVCETNRTIRLTQAELEAHPRWRGFGAHAKDHPPMRGWLAAPLVGRDGRNLGLVQLSDKEDGSEFDEHDEAIIVQLARHAADAIERVQAQAALAVEVEALARLQDVSTRLIADETPQAAYDAILTAATELMGSDCASLQMLNEAGDLRLLAHRGYDPRSADYWDTVDASSESTCGVALTTGERVIVPDVEDSGLVPDSGDLQSYRWTGMRAVQTTPLLSRSGRPLGMLSTHWKRPHTPSERDLKLFDVLARQAADAIERTLAQAELRESEARQAFLLSLSDALRPLTTPLEIASVAAERLAERFGLDRVFYAEFFGSLMRVERDFTRGVVSLVGEHDLTAFGPHLLRAYHQEPIVKVDDVRTDERFDEEARSGLLSRQVGAYLDVVLFEDDQWVSLLALQSALPRTWTASEEGLFREVGERVKAAIERARAEEKLRELNETLERRVAERTAERDRMWRATRDLMCVARTDGTLLSVNPAWERLLGLTEAELVGRVAAEIKHPEDAERTAAGLAQLAAGEPIDGFEDRYRHKDGSWRWISWSIEPAGDLIYCAGRDVTAEKKRAAEVAQIEAARREADALYRAYFENSAEALFVVNVLEDGGFTIEDLNPAHQTSIGLPLSEVKGKRLDEVLSPELAESVTSHYRTAIASQTAHQYREHFELHGRRTYWDTVLVPVRAHDGRIVRLIGSSRDLTAQLDAEEQLRQSQKMEAMGQLTGGVAHDFNNLLTPIVGSLDMLMRRGLGNEREQRLIGGAMQSAERAKTLVQRLLAFARRQPLEASAVDLPQLVNRMAGLMGSTLGPKVDVRVELEENLPPALADANQLEMALLNLAVNARDAMPEGGALTVSARRGIVRAGDRSSLKSGHYLRLSVADSGTGMDAQTLARAVEPFFSTKGIGKGTGLGLSMVHGLAAQLGGGLEITSELGRGTTVELWLPISHKRSDQANAEVDDLRPARLRGQAVLVDDEELVRMSTADMLVDLGYDVIEASSGEEALRLLRHSAQPDLLVTDHLMPGMSGVELAREARKLVSDLPVLIVSGYAELDGIASDLPRLTKPFRNSELAESLAETVVSKAAGS